MSKTIDLLGVDHANWKSGSALLDDPAPSRWARVENIHCQDLILALVPRIELIMF